MIFNSLSFIFAFLPVVLVVHFLVLKGPLQKYRILWLNIASLYFYANWNYRYLLLILVSVLFNYTFGSYLNRHKARWALILGVGANLLLLGYFKYYYFVIENLIPLGVPENWIFKPLLPLGISFFTFQQLAFLVDEYNNEDRIYSFQKYLLFVCFYPQLIAGPIVQHKQIITQFDKLNSFHEESFVRGCIVFVFGLAKKVLIADHLSKYVSTAFNATKDGQLISAIDSWIGILSYTFQIYFDFSGYSDMAIGLGLMFGLIMPLNFNSPYQATNISDFWRRWHITLSSFLRDYLYIPLGGNRHGIFRKNLNLFITMLLGGLWHGAGWNFLIWGGLHGLYLIICHNYKKILKIEFSPNLSWGITFLSVVFAWIFFRAANFAEASTFIKSLGNFNFSSHLFENPLRIALKLTLCLWICKSASNIQSAIGIDRRPTPKPRLWRLFETSRLQPRHVIYLILFLFIILDQISKEVSEFLYYQF